MGSFMAVFLAIFALSAFAGGHLHPDVPSYAFQTGLTLARNFEAVNSENFVESCLDKISSEVQDELHSVGFHYNAQLINQITDSGMRQKICNIYNNPERKSELDQCRRDEMGAKNAVTGVFVLLKLICETGKTVLERNSACLNDIEGNLHKSCVIACQRQAGLSVTPLGAEMDDRDSQMVCKLGACVIQCLSVQMQECEEDISTELKDFYDRLSGAQMLLGVEAAHVHGNGIPARNLLKSQKLPAKCQQIIQRSSRMVNKVSPEQTGKYKEHSLKEEISQ
uniref:Chondroitin proteoglycan 4 domain-containing protein n=1 Tax=Ditylenchus dipsaci TaxID=166011 RepID=A0A915DSD8_9BILA